jgi:hypothetical protein
MSHIIEQYISQCQDLYKPCFQGDNSNCNIDPLCDCQCNINQHCLGCLCKIFFEQEHRMRTYKCLPITYYYIKRFTDAFASEIYRILFQYDDIWNNIINKNIVSIGCGPATELIAIEKVMRDKSLQTTCQYVGFDLNGIWSSVWDILTNILQLHNMQISFQSNNLSANNPVLHNTKLLILNHVVSDVFKHSQIPRIDTYNFLQNDITPLIQQMPIDSFILINDVNSFKMGRDEIENWALSVCNAGIIEIGFFEHFEHINSRFNTPSAKRRIDRDSVFFPTMVCQSAYIILKRK